MELVIQVTDALADALLDPAGPGPARAVLERATAHGVEFTAHPGAGRRQAEPSFFSGEVATEADGEALVRELLALDGIELAYVKPDARPAF